MEWVIVAGAVMSALGLAGVIGCIVATLKARRAGLDDAAMRARLQKIVVWNMAALGLSMLGLMIVVVGVLLAR
ncbi:hypothetical protein [Acidimangrovimonas sediminis]|uniref:hypothetical protein n=1 Tax=Acidimangrovimonas sediminis TaxID=2056283 RepID=UPI000C81010F|nr:hypothetical protein [Acidimangrovimonas sediminis]